MAINKVAAIPITLREITMGDMAWGTGVAQTARVAVMPHSDARRPTTTSTHKPHPGLPQGEGALHNRLKHNKKELQHLGRAEEGLSMNFRTLRRDGKGFSKRLGKGSQ